MSHINEKTSIYLEIILKSLEFFVKASHHFKKNFNFIEHVFIIFEKASDFLLKLHFSGNVFKKPRIF
jgi:hypothetical protein